MGDEIREELVTALKTVLATIAAEVAAKRHRSTQIAIEIKAIFDKATGMGGMDVLIAGLEQPQEDPRVAAQHALDESIRHAKEQRNKEV